MQVGDGPLADGGVCRRQAALQQQGLKGVGALTVPGLLIEVTQITGSGLRHQGSGLFDTRVRFGRGRLHAVDGHRLRCFSGRLETAPRQGMLISLAQALEAAGVLIRTMLLEQDGVLTLDCASVSVMR